MFYTCLISFLSQLIEANPLHFEEMLFKLYQMFMELSLVKFTLLLHQKFQVPLSVI